MAESTTMPSGDTIATWAAEWADTFDQEWTDETLSEFVGKLVDANKPAIEEGEEPKGFVARIVGFSTDKLFFVPEGGSEQEVAYRFSLISDQGLQLPIFDEMVLKVVDEDE